ncbi:NADH-quinone oxidoreductase subunit J [Marinihelvus fidelis]|uniref:NADH-quinone oxidoreductase subunit J n=2 Tax=Marinihelvus fidelis TaxID=2613842 RepID=A0A5N0T5V9_9GAMM|nr:NADH-quinone oxidoreductase subunit J [Marinihelvus fidelis]
MGIELQVILFYLFSAILVGSALAVISSRNPVYSALFLVLTFFTAAALWILLQVEFLAVVLVVVYVGAVMVLFLFVVMMLDINLVPLKEGFVRFLPVGILVALIMAFELLAVMWTQGRFGEAAYPTPADRAADYSNTQAVGEHLYTQYLLPFEVAGVILLVAIVAATALTLRQRKGSKTQQPARQVRVKREERVRLVKMKSEAPNSGGGS